MKILIFLLLLFYGSMLAFILLYSLTQFSLLISYLRNKKHCVSEHVPSIEQLPSVTVQLPVYNEKYVIARLMDAVAAFEYPRSLLEIQVLDDSTDETVEIIAAKVQEIAGRGIRINHLRRKDRKGFKAGALAYGLQFAKGSLIAIFDADFLPRRDFLLKTAPWFGIPDIGVVQTRWEHLNEDFSLLTRLQAFGLDAHFSVEQKGRNAAGYFINFNGTAGVWRKRCIEDSGGWQADTLTEDLDLSYRAQLRGWRFKYLQHVGSPAELPVVMNALKTQQFRWTKGAAECTRKNLPMVLRSGNLSLATKIHAVFHLMNSFLFVCIISTALLSIPLLSLKHHYAYFSGIYDWAGIFLISLLILSAFYWVSLSDKGGGRKNRLLRFVLRFPAFLSVSMGLSLHNAMAVAEGYMGKKSPFIRTPKFNVLNTKNAWKQNRYLSSSINPLTLMEGLLSCYFTAGLFLAWKYQDFGLAPFHFMLAVGFGIVCWYSLLHSLHLLNR